MIPTLPEFYAENKRRSPDSLHVYRDSDGVYRAYGGDALIIANKLNTRCYFGAGLPVVDLPGEPAAWVAVVGEGYPVAIQDIRKERTK